MPQRAVSNREQDRLLKEQKVFALKQCDDVVRGESQCAFALRACAIAISGSRSITYWLSVCPCARTISPFTRPAKSEHSI